MQLSLFQATLFPGLVLLAAGLLLILQTNSVSAFLRAFPRSRRAAYVTMAVGAGWMLYNLTNLGEADFGNYKKLLIIGFAAIAIGSFKYSPDFLSVRGACIVYLLVAWVLRKAAYMQYDEPMRLLMVGPMYAGIAIALYLAYAPYRVRDFFGWLNGVPSRWRMLGMVVAVYGGVLSAVAFVY